MASCDEYRPSPRIRNEEWKEDGDLKEELFNFVGQNMKREEILDFVAQKYPMYAWSLRALCRCLRYHIDPVLTFGREDSERSPRQA